MPESVVTPVAPVHAVSSYDTCDLSATLKSFGLVYAYSKTEVAKLPEPEYKAGAEITVLLHFFKMEPLDIHISISDVRGNQSWRVHIGDDQKKRKVGWGRSTLVSAIRMLRVKYRHLL